MILHQIELQGFLSHRGTPQTDGGFGFSTIDFSRSPLWLIHGENGTGKSALFDAICFALYKRARGAGAGGHSSLNLGFLVHHGADRAQVRVTIEIGGTVYRVDRAVNHIDKPAPNNLSQIWQAKTDWETLCQMSADERDKSWDAVVGTKNKAEDWIETTLRMSFETFTYTALLRQGETDAFLVAEADKRKRCLLKMLDLSSFEELGTAASKENSAAKKNASDAATRRDGTRHVTPAEAEEAARVAGAAKEKQKAAEATFKSAEQALENGRKAAVWQNDISELETQNEQDVPLLERKDETVRNANRARELSQIMPQLSELWGAKTRLIDEEQNWRNIGIKLEKARENGVVSGEKLAPARENAAHAQTALDGAKDDLDAANQAAQKATDEAGELANIEKWEAQIERANQELAPLQSVLARESEITARGKRLNELNIRVPLLEHWEQAQKAERRAEKNLAEAQKAREDAALGLGRERKNEQGDADNSERARTRFQQSKDELRDFNAEFEQLKQSSNHRKKVEDEGVCHFCGSELDAEHIQKRLHEERALWNSRGHELKTRISQAESDLKTAEAEALAANQRHAATGKELRKFDLALGTADSAIQTGRESLSDRQENARRAAARCEAFANQLEVLEALQRELAQLEQFDVNSEMDALHEAKSDAIAGKTTIRNARAELEKLPDWSDEQRALVRSARAKVAANLQGANQAVSDADQLLKVSQKVVAELEKQIETNVAQVQNWEDQNADLSERCERIGAEVERLRGELPDEWRAHLCCEDAKALEQLKTENRGLSEAINQEIALRQTQERAQSSMAQIGALRARLDELPAQHRRAVAALRAELDEAEAAGANAESAWKEADGVRRDLESAAREFAAREADLLEAEVEADLCKTLADALGPKGLQRAIQEKAQQKLKAEADKTLLKLSGGDWSISLQETSEERLEIMATDHRSGHDKKFEYLSGGEKFRIAVALAVAIGQSATGSAPLGTLIIDEGFGALDAANRKRMVGELQRLSADVFGGGRVIVVSHQEDVCDDFPQRYSIARDENGMVSATRFPAA